MMTRVTKYRGERQSQDLNPSSGVSAIALGDVVLSVEAVSVPKAEILTLLSCCSRIPVVFGCRSRLRSGPTG